MMGALGNSTILTLERPARISSLSLESIGRAGLVGACATPDARAARAANAALTRHRPAFCVARTPSPAGLSLQRARVHVSPRSNVTLPIHAPRTLHAFRRAVRRGRTQVALPPRSGVVLPPSACGLPVCGLKRWNHATQASPACVLPHAATLRSVSHADGWDTTPPLPQPYGLALGRGGSVLRTRRQRWRSVLTRRTADNAFAVVCDWRSAYLIQGHASQAGPFPWVGERGEFGSCLANRSARGRPVRHAPGFATRHPRSRPQSVTALGAESCGPAASLRIPRRRR
jgi:hypothetical protein